MNRFDIWLHQSRPCMLQVEKNPGCFVLVAGLLLSCAHNTNLMLDKWSLIRCTFCLQVWGSKKSHLICVIQKVKDTRTEHLHYTLNPSLINNNFVWARLIRQIDYTSPVMMCSKFVSQQIHMHLYTEKKNSLLVIYVIYQYYLY